jgi:hypothetical protein
MTVRQAVFFSVMARANLVRVVRLTYQPSASSTFISEQTSHQQSASNTFLSEQISTSYRHQPNEHAGSGVWAQGQVCDYIRYFCALQYAP